MKKSFESAIEINASLDTVYNVLVGIDDYPKWNPLIPQMHGEISVDSQLDAIVQLPGQKGFERKITVKTVRPNKELRWTGGVKPWFATEHFFELEALSPSNTRLVQGEKFRGMLVPIIAMKMGKTIEKSIVNMNKALKARCEAIA